MNSFRAKSNFTFTLARAPSRGWDSSAVHSRVKWNIVLCSGTVLVASRACVVDWVRTITPEARRSRSPLLGGANCFCSGRPTSASAQAATLQLAKMLLHMWPGGRRPECSDRARDSIRASMALMRGFRHIEQRTKRHCSQSGHHGNYLFTCVHNAQLFVQWTLIFSPDNAHGIV